MSNTVTSIPELRQMAKIALAAPKFQPIGLVAAPGVGKTMFFQNDFRELYAEHHGLQTEDVAVIIEKIGQREDASVITGITVPSKNADGELVGVTAVPGLVERIRATGADYGVIVLDEFPQAPTDVQAACSDMLNPEEHKIGDYPIPPGWVVVFTGNRSTDKSGAKRVLSHLRNGRAVIFELEFDMESFADWWGKNDGHPLVIDCAMAHHDEGFFADAVPAEDTAYCTPRSLKRASDHLMAFTDSADFDGHSVPVYVEKLMAANIGSGAAHTIVQYIQLADKVPTGGEILDNPEGAVVPDETGFQLLAANRAIATAYDAETGEAALRYLVRLRADLQVSLGTKLLRMSAAKGWVLTSDESNDFIAKYHDLLPLADCGLDV